MAMPRRRTTRLFLLGGALLAVYFLFFHESAPEVLTGRKPRRLTEIKSPAIPLLLGGGVQTRLDAQKHPFFQVRVGREADEDWAVDDVMGQSIRDGIEDYWNRFQKPNMVNSETRHTDNQLVRSAIEDLLALNGWVQGACPTLVRPFSTKAGITSTSQYSFLEANPPHLYFMAIVIHSADHFLVDQLALIIQLAKRLGPEHIFVSMLDYYSTDATPSLLDLCEAVLTLLSIPFRIRRVPGLTAEDSASYYPLEEAYSRNLVLEPLHQLQSKRGVKFSRVIWLKGFTCPNDILESLKISFDNSAAMVCGMDWAEHSGSFIFSDRWRTRDIQGDQFRQSKSTASPPPRDPVGIARYTAHLPFQVFCCESGTHIVDPHQSYYRDIKYRASTGFYNLTSSQQGRKSRDGDEECMDSSQSFFCRDIWVSAAKENLRERERSGKGPAAAAAAVKAAGPAWAAGEVAKDAKAKDTKAKEAKAKEEKDAKEAKDIKDAKEKDKRADPLPPAPPAAPPAKLPNPLPHPGAAKKVDAEKVKPLVGGGWAKPAGPEPKKPGNKAGDEAVNELPKDEKNSNSDANRGSDFDAMPDSDEVVQDPSTGHSPLLIPNTLFTPARILVNPRCVTTYAGVSHTQLARDLFGEEGEEKHDSGVGGKYVLDDWDGAPDSFVCQEQRTTGGRKATKTQRRVGFSVHDELERMGVNV